MLGKNLTNYLFHPPHGKMSKFIFQNSKCVLSNFSFSQAIFKTERMFCRIFTNCRVVLLILLVILNADKTSFGAALVLDESMQHSYLAPYIEILDDPDHQWTIHDVIKPPLNSQFQKVENTHSVNRGLTDSTLWLRFTLIDRTSPDFSGFILNFNRPPVINIEFYSPDPESSGWKIQYAGDIKIDSKSGPKRMLFFPLSVKKNEPVECYLHVSTNYTPLFLPLTVSAIDTH